MLGIGGTELFIIVVFVLLIFGPDKLPQLGRTIGRFMKEFKRAQDSMEAQIRSEMRNIEDIGKPGSKTKPSAGKSGSTGVGTEGSGSGDESPARSSSIPDADEWDEEEEEEE